MTATIEFTEAHRGALAAAQIAARQTECSRRETACDLFVLGMDSMLEGFEPLIAVAVADRAAIEDLFRLSHGISS